MRARATTAPSCSGFTIDQIGAIMSHVRPDPPDEDYLFFRNAHRWRVRGPDLCSDYKCSHSTAISADQWSDHVRLSDLEARFVCKACGKREADVRPDFNWNENPVAAMGYR
jgi:hypothetical protein